MTDNCCGKERRKRKHKKVVPLKNKNIIVSRKADYLLVPRTGSATEFAADIDDLTVVAAFMIANHHVIFHAPAELVGDIRLFWERIECGNCSRVAAADKTPSRVSHSASHKLA